jgi:cytochrome c oxidase accessory protein FixG
MNPRLFPLPPGREGDRGRVNKNITMVQFKKEEQEKPDFRDRLATIDEKGSRVWVYAKRSKGRLTKWRNIVGFALMAFFFTAPFIRLHGEPLLLLNFIDREIVILGVRFWPQDFHLFFLAMISLMVFVILFTVTFGRLFCGWACPQTVFMELIFRRIEYWIEGDAYHQKQLDKQPWNANKLFRKALKHIVFYVISFIIGNFFLMYIIGSEAWGKLITESPSEHIAGLSGMLVFSAIFYFIFSWFREQVCTIVCPYGRLQGVLLDRNSIIITYDYKRGEPRGTFFKGEDREKAGKGSCINCTQCVQVCPTGIDIRNGTQLECINCACCIDACNHMMDSTNQPRGLIRYASEKIIAEGDRVKFNPRTLAYSAVLVILLGVITFALTAREPIEATILRAPGMLYQEPEPGKFSNLYTIKLVNKTKENLPVEIKLLSPQGIIQIIGNDIKVKEQTVGESAFFLLLDKSIVTSAKNPVKFGVYSNGKLIQEVNSTFVGPDKP